MIDQLKAEMKTAMKAKDKVRLATIRSVISAIQYQEMEKKTEPLPEKECLAVVRSEIKKRKESLEFAQNADRSEEVEQLGSEISVLEEFLPQQLSEEQLRNIITEFRSANPESQLGDVMKHLNGSHSGQFDGKLASEVARSVLS